MRRYRLIFTGPLCIIKRPFILCRISYARTMREDLMKKHGSKKLLALTLAVALGAAVFTGCSIFEYNEDADLNQVILEIAPMEYTYEVPMYEDYTDPDGNKVYAINEDPDSADYGKTTTETVKAVKRTHDGEPIHKAKKDGDEVLYIGYEKTAEGAYDYTRPVEVKQNDPRIYAEKDGKNNDNHYVEPESGEEYEFVRYCDNGTNKYAEWKHVSDGVLYAGDIVVDGNESNTASGAANYRSFFPTVTYYTATGGRSANWEWYENIPVYETATAMTEGEVFYKTTMIDYFDQYAYSMVTEEGYTVEECFDEFVEMLYTSYLTGVEADIYRAGGYIENGYNGWGVTEWNNVNRSIYDQIDMTLEDLYEEISSDYDQTWPDIAGDTEESTSDEVDEEYEKDYEVWHITQEPERLIGNTDDAKLNSLQRKGMRKFVDTIEDAIEDSYTVSDSERAHYLDEINQMRGMLTSNENTDKLYVTLYKYDVIWYLYGESEEYTLKTSELKEYIVKDVTEDEAGARLSFASELAAQKAEFTDDIEAYYTAATGNETILYFADEEIFWVKHILIPFSDEQTAALENYKNAGNSDAAVNAYRERLGAEVEVYKYVDGVKDESRSYTFDQAWADIRAKMNAVASDPYAASRTFDELIDTYNTDEGIKNNEMGYAVTATSEDEGGRDESYMIEFATESRALYRAYKKGMSLYDFKASDPNDSYKLSKYDDPDGAKVGIGSISVPVLTDYGWHILYLNFVPRAGQTRSFDEYLTSGRYTTAGASFITDITTMRDNYYNNWRTVTVDGYTKKDGLITAHPERFGTKLDEYEKQFAPEDTEEETEETTDDTTTTTTTE